MKGVKNHFFGKKHTLKTRKRMSENHIDVSKKNNPMYGKKQPYNIKVKMSAIRQGVDINDWKKFVSFEPYDQNFNKEFKKLIRERDNNICMLCQITSEKLRTALAVHHIDYNKKNTKKESCVSLCRNCHTKTNFNRKHWTIFFKSILKEKYGYKY